MYVEKERGNYMDQTYMKEQPVLKLILSKLYAERNAALPYGKPLLRQISCVFSVR